MERYVAVDFVCAWPNLTLMPNGEVAAMLFNQPCHGRWEGEIECWASADGRFWTKRGVPAPHEPGTARMNKAAGLSAEGELLAIVSGFTHRPPVPDPVPVYPHDPIVPGAVKGFGDDVQMLTPWVCRSHDAGRTWTHEETVTYPEGIAEMVPFGDIVQGADDVVAVTFYVGRGPKESAFLCRSHDDGRTWDDFSLIGDDINEVALLHLGEGRWLAAARSADHTGLKQFRSDDNGETWRPDGVLTLSYQHPGHLLRLADGRVLLSFGIRNPGLHGVGVRFSEDEGKTWGSPRLLLTYGDLADDGYPSSVQLADGTVVTAYYSQMTDAHQRYHMGAVRWHGDNAKTFQQMGAVEGGGWK